jgi:hypothetical protein
LLGGLVAFGLGLGVGGAAGAQIVEVRVERQTPYAGGTAFGDAGPYVEIVGVARGELDPVDPRNRGIADLELAPRNARGRIDYKIDFHILRPADPARASATLVYDVANRGMRVLLPLLHGPHDAPAPGAGAPPELGNGFALRRGYTVMWSGWDPTVQQGLRARLPVAVQAGRPLQGRVRDEFVPGAVRSGPWAAAPRLSYPVDDPASVRLALRRREGDPREELPAGAWRIAEGRLDLTPGGRAFEPGVIYDVWYTARDPWVLGIGFAATRDWVSFLRRGSGDAAHPAQPTNPIVRDAGYSAVLATGISQSGRFLRHFLELGMNRDAAGGKVFDGVLIHVAGAGKLFGNHRFGQPGRTAGQHSDRRYPENWFPFAHQSVRDPLSGRIAGLWHGDGSDPVVMELNTATEYWHKGASLLHTDPLAQRDLEPPDSVRHYLIAGMEHASGMDVAPPDGVCANPSNPHHAGPLLRALLVALEQWVGAGVQPPPSRVPLLSDGTLIPLEQLRFPAIPGLARVERIHSIGPPSDWVDPPPADSASYAVRVPAVDADGNERAGVRLPDVAVPLGTYTGWNVFADPALAPDLCGRYGSFAALPATPAEREARADPRPSVLERYPTRESYVRRVERAAAELVDARLLLPEDARAYVERARAQPGPWP